MCVPFLVCAVQPLRAYVILQLDCNSICAVCPHSCIDGSHLTRSLVLLCNPAQRITVWRNIESTVLDVATSHFGKWTLQELIKSSTTSQELAACEQTLTPEVIFILSRDKNGAHILKTCVFDMDPKSCQFIYNIVTADVMRLAKHKFGCATLQRCLESGTDEQKQRLASAIAQYAKQLAVDNHGNYILQFIAQMELDGPKRALVDTLKGSYKMLSQHKFGSNVVEKCILPGETDTSGSYQVVMAELMIEGVLEKLLSDPYGNYVVQG